MTFPKRPKSAGKQWVMHVPVISTSHMTREDDAVLEIVATAASPLTDFAVAALFDGIGYLLVIEEWESDARLSDDLNSLIAAFDGLGYSQLCLDPDGDILPDVKTFKW